MAEKAKTVKIQSGEGGALEIPYEYALLMPTVKNMLEGLPDETLNDPIPVQHVKPREFKKIVDWCKHKLETPESNERGIRDLDDWEKAFVGDMDQPATFQLILAANYLDMKPLLNLLCKSVALNLAAKTPEQIKEYFGIKRDFTPEEIEEMRRERGLIPPDPKDKDKAKST